MSYVEITKKITFTIPGCSRCTMCPRAIVVVDLTGKSDCLVVPPLETLKITMTPDDEPDDKPSFGWRADGRHFWSGVVVFPCGHVESFLDEVRQALAEAR